MAYDELKEKKNGAWKTRTINPLSEHFNKYSLQWLLVAAAP